MKPMKTKIQVKCIGADNLSLNEMESLQGDLKSLSKESFEKLKQSLIDHGFCFPFFVWKNNGKNWYIDGTQRDRVIRQMEQTGAYELPDVWPVAFIEAKDKKEAANLILLQSSAYGKVEPDELYKFIHDNEIEWDALKMMIDIPEIDIPSFDAGYFGNEIPKSDDSEKIDNETGDDKITCPKCGYKFKDTYKQTDEHIKKRKRFGETNSVWKGDEAQIQTGRKRAERMFKKRPCERCGKKKTDRHHKDENPLNNSRENIKFLCRKCHMIEHKEIKNQAPEVRI